MEESQVKTRTTLLESLKIMTKQFSETMKAVFGNDEEFNITSVEDIPDLDKYMNSGDVEIIEDIKAMRKIEEQIRKMENKRQNAIKSLEKQKQNSQPRKHVKAKIVREVEENQK